MPEIYHRDNSNLCSFCSRLLGVGAVLMCQQLAIWLKDIAAFLCEKSCRGRSEVEKGPQSDTP